MKKAALIIAVCASLAGCAGALKKPDASTDYGFPPIGYEQAVKDHFDATLKDPESARYRIGKPVKAYANNGIIHGGGIGWAGYLVDVQVNAKNSFGGYAGYSAHIVLFKGENVYRVFDGSKHPMVTRLGN